MGKQDSGLLQTPLAVGQALSRWNLSDVEERYYPGEPAAMADRVDYRFINGWVATGDLPCRVALRQEVAGRSVALPDLTFGRVFLGTVDLSEFCHRPTWRVCHAQCRIEVDRPQLLRFRVATVGGVHIWLGEDLAHRFEPFDRNVPHESAFGVEVSPGTHRLTVRFEDLHERDTRFGFRLELTEGQGVVAGIDCDADAAGLSDAAGVLDGLRLTRVLHLSGHAVLTSDALPETPRTVFSAALPGGQGVLSQSHPELAVDLPPGCPVTVFETEVGGVRLSRSLGTTVLPGSPPLSAERIRDRKAGLLARRACGTAIEGVLAALADGTWSDREAAAFDTALTYVEERRDCADFRMMSLLWIWVRHRMDLGEGDRRRLSDAILGFRYWMDEPGDDVMWFWSENHVLCFHAAQYLAGHAFPEDRFAASGRVGREQAEIGRARLRKVVRGDRHSRARGMEFRRLLPGQLSCAAGAFRACPGS